MIVVLNPNSSRDVTLAIEEACAGTGLPAGSWRVEQLDDGPAVIETQGDVDLAAELVVRYVKEVQPDTLVVACHSDPGVREARKQAPESLILGIGETSMQVAAAWAEQFGVVSLSQEAVARKWTMVQRLGLDGRCAAIEPTATGVLHGVSGEPDIEPYVIAATHAREKGARSVVLGCAGMARTALQVQARVGIPVVEPVAAALLVAAARSV